MRKLLIAVLMLGLLAAALPVMAAPAPQLSGCSEPEGLEFGMRFFATALNGVDLTVTAVAVDEFNPAITVLNEDGEIVACNDDGRDVAGTSVNLPSVQAGPSELSATITARIPSDERRTLEIIVTSVDGSYGEFVLLVSGASVFPATDEDIYQIQTNEGMAANQVPLGIYVMNLGLPENPLNPRVTFSFGEDFSQTCSASSSSTLCQGDSEDLSGEDADGNPFSVTLEEGEEPIELTGNDVMLYFEAGGDPALFDILVDASASDSTGPYYLAVHSGVGNPIEEGAE